MISSLQKEGFFIKHNSSKRLHLESALETVRYLRKKSILSVGIEPTQPQNLFQK